MCVYGGDILWVYWCMTFMENISFQNEENVWQWKTILPTSGTQLIVFIIFFPTMTPFWHLHISSKNLPLFVNVCVWGGGNILSVYWYMMSMENISFKMREVSDSGKQSSLWMVHVCNFCFNQNFNLALPHWGEENIISLLMYDDYGEYQLLKW
jgi:hypothetical protein